MNGRVSLIVLLVGAGGAGAGSASAETVTAAPGGTFTTTKDGIVYQPPSRVRAAPAERPRGDGTAVNDAPLPNLGPAKSAPGPLGAPVVNAAFVTRRGTVARFEKGISITILEKNGKERTVPLAKNASV